MTRSTIQGAPNARFPVTVPRWRDEMFAVVSLATEFDGEKIRPYISTAGGSSIANLTARLRLIMLNFE